jgi:hypothetical protein
MNSPHVACWTLTAVTALLGGCARTVVLDALPTNYSANDPAEELEFMSKLGSRPVISNDEGLPSLLVCADGSDAARR